MEKIKISQKAFKPFVMFGCKIPDKKDPGSKNASCIYLGITLNGVNIGNVVIWKCSKTDYYIDNIQIKAKYRNKGYGSKALQLILKKYKKQNFHLSALEKAVNYYIKNGFKPVKKNFEQQCFDLELIR